MKEMFVARLTRDLAAGPPAGSLLTGGPPRPPMSLLASPSRPQLRRVAPR